MSASNIYSNYVEVQGLDIHYIEKGGKLDTTILFVHGRAMSAACWEKQFTDEKLSGFRLIALDLPGHGLSGRSEDINAVYSLSGFAEVLAVFIDRLQLTNYVLAGLSVGGHVAVQALPRLKNCRGAFVMTMPFTKPIQFDRMFSNSGAIVRAYSDDPSEDDITRYISLLFRPKVDQIPSIMRIAFEQTDARIHEGIMNGVIAGDYLNETEILRGTDVPVAVLAGCDEQIHNLTYLHGLDIPVWRHSCQMVPGAGHLLNWENPEAADTLLLEFIQDLP